MTTRHQIILSKLCGIVGRLLFTLNSSHQSEGGFGTHGMADCGRDGTNGIEARTHPKQVDVISLVTVIQE